MTRSPRRPRRRAATAGGRAGVRIWLFAGLAAAAVVILCAFALWGPGPPAPARSGATTVVLEPGEGVGRIGGDLAAAHVVRSGLLFVAAAELLGAGHGLKAGEYAFPSRISLAGVVEMLRKGRVVRHFVTVPEGLASIAVAALLADDPVLVGSAPVPPEGSVLPETYEVRRGETRADVEARMERARDALLDGLWAGRAPGLPYRTPEEAVTLGSIVEKETALPAERPRVAAVFLNRLARGMRLASDPTVIYGLTKGRPLGHGLTVSELASMTPYNTYRVAGLPPSPIANPGRAALAAALHPAQSRDLYFVADGTGGHAFSDNLEAHERNVARWRQIEGARRVKPNVQ